jgi:nitroreductase
VLWDDVVRRVLVPGPETSLFDAIDTLRAVRRYKPDPIAPEHLYRILKAATTAGSSGNTQPWEYLLVQDAATKATLKAILTEAFAEADKKRAQSLEDLKDGAGRSVTGHAAIDSLERVPVLVLCFWNPDRGIRMQEEYTENPDGTLAPGPGFPIGGRGNSIFPACQNMMLAAHALGVGSLFTNFLQLVDKEVKDLLDVPPRMFFEATIFLGYSDEKLGRPRRMPVEAVTHLNQWGTAYRVPDGIAVGS